MRLWLVSVSLLVAALACSSGRREAAPPSPTAGAPAHAAPAPRAEPPVASRTPPPAKAAPPADSVRRMAPPDMAYTHGWMPLASTGVDRFLRAHPEADGRGVLIGIRDTGIDPSVPGLLTTSTGTPKVLDVRDFSAEGAVALTQVKPAGDTVTIRGRKLGGFSRVVALNTTGPYYGGTIAEIPLGDAPAADLDGNGVVRDTLPVIVVKAPDGWVLFADTDENGSLADEHPVHDYLVGRETFGWTAWGRGRAPKVAVAVNVSDSAGAPKLDLVFDTGAHGTHVAGIASGHDLYGVHGFDGVAPGAQLLGLKIANSAQGGVSTTGSMERALDYAIRFAAARRLPLVLNLSFGVGNEIEGQARIDAIVDSTLAAHPEVVLTISAGNDGPGLSTVGFPGSAARAIGVGATLPGSFLPTGPTGAPSPDLLAYFSSRGGEVARPDIVTPGVAYSTVPLWDAGEEVNQGTSMASPHAAGLAALLMSALTADHRPILARTIRQALMVTAQPLPGATMIDEGTGLPDIDRAYRWLAEAKSPAPDIQVRAVGRGDATGAMLRGRAGAADTVQSFELLRPPGQSPSTYALRSDAPWLTAPASIALRGERATVQLRVARHDLPPGGAAVGVVSGWTDDTAAGPAFRLVTTVVSATPMSDGTRQLRAKVPLAGGATLRTFFAADSGRPFALTVETAGVAERALAFLHEPDGMPFRDEAARTAGFGPQSAEYETDSRDVQRGAYEAVVVAPPHQAITATVSESQSPVALRATREGSAVRVAVTNLTAAAVNAELGMHLGGAVRNESVQANGSAPRRIPFVVPAWSRGVVVDVAMDRAQWSRFTDFGLTLFDSLGRQLGKQPINYAFTRLQVELPEAHGDMPVTLGLFPGFADSAGDQHWALQASIRVYADTSVVLTRSDSSGRSIAPHATAHAAFVLPPLPWPLPAGFAPLGLLVARADDRSWTREVELGPSGTGLVP
ncbi:MAG: S8 family serine peptidase [Gemmatimonadales bacterium]